MKTTVGKGKHVLKVHTVKHVEGADTYEFYLDGERLYPQHIVKSKAQANRLARILRSTGFMKENVDMYLWGVQRVDEVSLWTAVNNIADAALTAAISQAYMLGDTNKAMNEYKNDIHRATIKLMSAYDECVILGELLREVIAVLEWQEKQETMYGND